MAGADHDPPRAQRNAVCAVGHTRNPSCEGVLRKSKRFSPCLTDQSDILQLDLSAGRDTITRLDMAERSATTFARRFEFGINQVYHLLTSFRVGHRFRRGADGNVPAAAVDSIPITVQSADRPADRTSDEYAWSCIWLPRCSLKDQSNKASRHLPSVKYAAGWTPKATVGPVETGYYASPNFTKNRILIISLTEYRHHSGYRIIHPRTYFNANHPPAVDRACRE